MRIQPRYLLSILALVILLARGAAAQTDTSRPATPTVDSTARPSTPPSRGTAPATPPAPAYHMTKSPLTATLFGIIPGGGQVYDENYIRAVAFAGVCGFFIGRAIYYNGLYQTKASEVEALPATDTRVARLKLQRESYRDTRDLNAALYLGCHILSLIDAYVGAHLFDFDVSDDASSRIMIDPIGRQVAFSIRW